MRESGRKMQCFYKVIEGEKFKAIELKIKRSVDIGEIQRYIYVLLYTLYNISEN